jgi:hypothetical protein
MVMRKLNRKAERRTPPFWDAAFVATLQKFADQRVAPSFAAHLAEEYADAALAERRIRASRSITKTAKHVTGVVLGVKHAR